MLTLRKGDRSTIGAPIIESADGRSILVQSDWDWPGVAGTFGWSIRHVSAGDDPRCTHDGTDGTIDCPCGATVADFIGSARDWIDTHDGATTDDPGYFGEDWPAS